MSYERKAPPGDFGLVNAGLVVSPDAPLMGLMDDTCCLFDVALGALEQLTDSATLSDVTPPELAASWWPMLYTMRQARLLFGHAYERAHAEAANQRAAGAGLEQQLARADGASVPSEAVYASGGGAAVLPLNAAAAGRTTHRRTRTS